MVFRLIFTVGGLVLGIFLGFMTYNMLIETTKKTGESNGLGALAGVGVFFVLTVLGSEVGKAVSPKR